MASRSQSGSVTLYLLIFLIIGGLLALVISLSYQNTQLREQTQRTIQNSIPSLSPSPIPGWNHPDPTITRGGANNLVLPSSIPSGKVNLKVIKDGCVVGGCSNELCHDPGEKKKDISMCLYLDEYGCYESAVCERQKNGACGWTETDSLKKCFEDKTQMRNNLPM